MLNQQSISIVLFLIKNLDQKFLFFLVYVLLINKINNLSLSFTKLNVYLFSLIKMSNLEEKLNILKKKKLTAKTIVEQQRNEIRLLKSSLTIDERLQKIYENLPDKTLLNETIYRKIISNNHQTQTSPIDIHQLIENLSKIIEQILHLLSIKSPIQLSNIDCEQILVNQKESFQLIKWKLSDLYANRIADEVSCITS